MVPSFLALYRQLQKLKQYFLICRVGTKSIKVKKQWSDWAETFRIGFFGPDRLYPFAVINHSFKHIFATKHIFNLKRLRYQNQLFISCGVYPPSTPIPVCSSCYRKLKSTSEKVYQKRQVSSGHIENSWLLLKGWKKGWKNCQILKKNVIFGLYGPFYPKTGLSFFEF